MSARSGSVIVTLNQHQRPPPGAGAIQAEPGQKVHECIFPANTPGLNGPCNTLAGRRPWVETNPRLSESVAEQKHKTIRAVSPAPGAVTRGEQGLVVQLKTTARLSPCSPPASSTWGVNELAGLVRSAPAYGQGLCLI